MVPFPEGPLRRVPAADRVPPLGESLKNAYRAWYNRKFGGPPSGGWDIYDIHHNKPRQFGGTNDFDNLVPVLRETHQQKLNVWWMFY
jgi:filamentous hemagglutinin